MNYQYKTRHSTRRDDGWTVWRARNVTGNQGKEKNPKTQPVQIIGGFNVQANAGEGAQQNRKGFDIMHVLNA